MVDAGLELRENSGTTPAPVRLAVWGLPGPLSETESVALTVPAAVGLNVTAIEQLTPAVIEAEQLLVSAKSLLFVPEVEMPEMLSVAVPLFVNIIVWLAVVLSGTLPKSS